MAQIPPRPRSRNDFRIAIICALPLEAEMVQSVFDKDWADEEDIDLGQAEGDQNAYSIGRIGNHNVVLIHMPNSGGLSAASVAAHLRSSYHKIEVAFVVGICGVTPKHPFTQEEIVLGDCIISTKVIQYDFGWKYPRTFKRKAGLKDTLGRANPTIQAMIAKLRTAPNLERLSSRLRHHLQALQKEVLQIEYPGCHEDRLFKDSYLHEHHNVETCDDCMKDIGICTKDCETLKCSGSELVDRNRLKEDENIPQVHFGCYGSANTVLKSGQDRECLVKSEGIVAFEMEGAGVWDILPTILIKSACDYADSHKNKKWQRYAAASAAAALKSVLEFWKTTDAMREHGNIANPVPASLGANNLICEADKAICEYYRSGNRLLIERLSGEGLELEKCFINLTLIERRQDKEEKSSFSLTARLRLGASDMSQNIALETLFEPKMLASGKTDIPRRIFIQGRAGIGKTTLCKKIVYEFLGGRLGQTLFDRLLWIPLRRIEISQKVYGWQEFLQDVYPLTSPKWRQAKELYADQFYDPVFLSRTLLLFDGLDEISHQWKRDVPMYEFLKTTICDAPNIIVTSRPQANTLSIRYDLDLETIGFTPPQVSTYIKNCVEDEEAVVRMEAVISRKPLLQGLLRIPVQLDAFCYVWTNEACSEIYSSFTTLDMDNSITMTTLYQSIVVELCRKDLTRLQRVDQPQRLMPFQVLPWLKEELEFLAELAFQGMVNNVIEFRPKYQDRIGAYLSQPSMAPSAPYSSILERLSFLRTSDGGGKEHSKQNYYFIHLTFQEFFAAKHFVNHWLDNAPLTCLQLASSGSHQSKRPLTFLQEEKYNPRYNIFWRFVTGLISQKEDKVVQIFAQLHAEPVDLLGAAHHRLLMYCLSEVVSYQNREVQELCYREADLLKQRLIFEYKATGETRLGTEAEFPEKLLRDCLQNEVDLPYMETLSMIKRRSGVQLETLEAIKGKLVSGFSMPIRLQAANVLIKNSTVCPSHILDRAIAVFVAAFRSEDKDTQQSAIRTLRVKSLSSVVVNALIAVLQNKDMDIIVRSSTARVLGIQSLPEAINVLIAALQNKDEDTSVRNSAAHSLGGQSFLPEGTVNALVAALQKKGEEYIVRMSTLRGLGGQSSLPEEAVDALIAVAFKDEDSVVRIGAARVLGAQSSLPERAINVLITALEDEDEDSDVRSAAIIAIKKQSLPERAISALIIALKNGGPNVQFYATEALGRQSLSERAIDTLIAALNDEDEGPGVRSSAARVLGAQLSLPDEAISALIAALKDEDSNVRGPAVIALKRQYLPHEAINALTTALDDEDSDVRYSAAIALERQSLPDGAINALIATLNDEDSDVRHSAAYALERQVSLSDEAITVLARMLREDNSKVYDILHRQESFFRKIKNFDNQTWTHIWSAWLKKCLYNDISCYEIQGALYLRSGEIRHQISSDLARTSQLLEAVSNVQLTLPWSDIPEDEAVIIQP